MKDATYKINCFICDKQIETDRVHDFSGRDFSIIFDCSCGKKFALTHELYEAMDDKLHKKCRNFMLNDNNFWFHLKDDDVHTKIPGFNSQQI